MNDKELISIVAFARRANRSRQTIQEAIKRGKLHREPGGKLDPENTLNQHYLATCRAADAVKAVDELEDAEPSLGPPPAGSSSEVEKLYEQKLRGEVRRIEAMASKYELEVKRTKGDLVLRSVITRTLGAFAAAIRDNVLTIGEAVSRGDEVLRDRIEKTVSTRLQRTKEVAIRAIDLIIDIPGARDEIELLEAEYAGLQSDPQFSALVKSLDRLQAKNPGVRLVAILEGDDDEK